jgi:hypothetical protein
MSDLSGDFKELADIIESFERTSTEGLAKSTKAAAAVSLTLVRNGMREQVAPDGTPWPELQDRTDHPPLEKSGRLEKGWKPVSTPTSFGLINEVPYAGYQQHGTDKIPARPMVPEDDLGTWEEPIKTAIEGALLGSFKKGQE